MNISQLVKNSIRDVPDFPKEGILFRDITPVLADPQLSIAIAREFNEFWQGKGIDGVVGVESRGFIFGMQLAQQLNVPFIPVRKAGKLPFDTIKHSYDLEYGSAEMEIHVDAIVAGQNILIHDDLLATGGTAAAAAELVQKCGGNVGGFCFLVELAFLTGRDLISSYERDIQSVAIY